MALSDKCPGSSVDKMATQRDGGGVEWRRCACVEDGKLVGKVHVLGVMWSDGLDGVIKM